MCLGECKWMINFKGAGLTTHPSPICFSTLELISHSIDTGPPFKNIRASLVAVIYLKVTAKNKKENRLECLAAEERVGKKRWMIQH